MSNYTLIIGASSDIGLDLINNMIDDSIILAHYNSSGKTLKALAEKHPNTIIPIQANLASEEEISSLIKAIETQYGTPKTIVHLAAPRFENIRFKDIDWPHFQKEIDISLKSIILILSHFLPLLAKQKQGKVVIMLSSVVMNIPPKALTQYTTVKYALLGLVKSLASEYATKNIQINALSPSMVDTKFLDDINEKIVELSAYNHPLKRNAQVNDITPVIKMLMSKGSDFMNGINIPITGGSIF